jgi:transposase InsO family protein
VDGTGEQSENFRTHRHNPVQSTTCSNGRCERFIQTLKLECLAKFIIFGKQHLDYLLADFTVYYNTVRSHMEREHLSPTGVIPDEVETLPLEQVLIKSHVGGLVKSFERKAA